MSTDLIRYDLLVQDALKSVVRRVLTDAARDGLPGDHHFYISFRTDHGGAKISPRLRERYPRDMTIVLQHQFERLIIGEGSFEVGLSFSNIPERLKVPFESLTGFFDPSVQFGLKFEPAEPAAEERAPEAPVADISPARPSPVPKLPPRRLEVVEDTKRDEAAKEDAGGGEVVSLDSFRKKS